MHENLGRMDDDYSPASVQDSLSDPVDAPAPSRDFSAVVLGDHVIQPWYSSSYPKKLVGDATSAHCRLYVCELCFKYTVDLARAVGHQRLCKQTQKTPPGRIVNEKDGRIIYALDGEEHSLFCQNLSLFAKLFLDTKSICFDVESFLFYTLVERDPETQLQHIVGFFSKEKMSWDDYNLACILVFPPYQRRGLGKRLIAFSYELSKMENKIGSPEKPLSDLGLKGYVAFWSYCIIQAIMKSDKDALSVEELSRITYIHPDDVVVALETLGIRMDRSMEEIPALDMKDCKTLMATDGCFECSDTPGAIGAT